MKKVKDNLFDNIDKDLAKLGKVSRFYSDDDNITITTDYNTYKANRSMLDGIMGDYGYEFYDYGDNGDKVMLTYNKVSDSRNVKDSLENTKFEQEYRTWGKKDRYMLLSRMKSDCDYYLGNGGKNAKHLWANDEEEHIKDMISLWNSFSSDEKPEWLTYEELNDYSIAMTGKSLDEWGVQVTDSRRVKDSDDEYLLQEIARQLEEGYYAGYEPQWDIDITVDGIDISEFDDYDQDLIYRDIAYVVKDGYDNYMGIETELSDGSIVYVDFVLNY